MEVSQIVFRVQLRIERDLVLAVAVSPVDSFNSYLSGPSQLVQNKGWVELFVAGVQIVGLSVISFFDVFGVEFVELEKVKNIAHVSFQELLGGVFIRRGVGLVEIQASLVGHVVSSGCKESCSGGVVSPVLRIFLNLWQIILDEIKRRLVQFLNLLQSWRLLLLHSVDAEFKNLEQRIFINFEWLIESSRVSDLVGSFNVHSCGSSLHFYVSREPISSSSESIGGCAHHYHSSILNWSSEPLSKLIERRLWCKRRGQRGSGHRSYRSWCES